MAVGLGEVETGIEGLEFRVWDLGLGFGVPGVICVTVVFWVTGSDNQCEVGFRFAGVLLQVTVFFGLNYCGDTRKIPSSKFPSSTLLPLFFSGSLVKTK